MKTIDGNSLELLPIPKVKISESNLLIGWLKFKQEERKFKVYLLNPRFLGFLKKLESGPRKQYQNERNNKN